MDKVSLVSAEDGLEDQVRDSLAPDHALDVRSSFMLVHASVV